MKHESSTPREKRKLTDTAEHRLNLAFMRTSLWTQHRGDQAAEKAHHAQLRAEQDQADETARIEAIASGTHTPLFPTPKTPYDQELEAERIAERIALEAESPHITSLATHRAKKLLELSSDTDPVDHSDIA